MSITVEATVQNGSLKLKHPLTIAEGTEVSVTVTPVEEIDDPLADVIGICTEGPDISLAQRHDEILYGLKKQSPEQP